MGGNINRLVARKHTNTSCRQHNHIRIRILAVVKKKKIIIKEKKKKNKNKNKKKRKKKEKETQKFFSRFKIYSVKYRHMKVAKIQCHFVTSRTRSVCVAEVCITS